MWRQGLELVRLIVEENEAILEHLVTARALGGDMPWFVLHNFLVVADGASTILETVRQDIWRDAHYLDMVASTSLRMPRGEGHMFVRLEASRCLLALADGGLSRWVSSSLTRLVVVSLFDSNMFSFFLFLVSRLLLDLDYLGVGVVVAFRGRAAIVTASIEECRMHPHEGISLRLIVRMQNEASLAIGACRLF
jgi:hypothetical protein